MANNDTQQLVINVHTHTIPEIRIFFRSKLFHCAEYTRREKEKKLSKESIDCRFEKRINVAIKKKRKEINGE